MGGPKNLRRNLLLLLAFVAHVYLVSGQCQHDIYFIIDASTPIEPTDCLLPDFFTRSWTNWMAWRQQTVEVLKFFEPMVIDGTVNAGVQLYGGQSLPQTIGNYTVSPTFTEAIAYLSTLAEPLCSGSQSFVPFLAQAIDSNSQFQNWKYTGPYERRPRENTTRTAIVMSMTSSTAFSDALILQRMIPVHQQMDNEIYITKTNPEDANVDALRERQIRLAACGDLSMNCSNIFYMDALNDFDVPISLQSIMNLIEIESCDQRSVEVENFNSTCDPAGYLDFTIPSDLLGTLGPADLQFLDPSCSVGSFVVDGDNIVISVALGSCGDIVQYDGSGNTVIFQQLSSRSVTPLNLQFNATCSYPSSHLESVGPLKPQGIIVREDVEKMSTYPLSLALFSDDTFTNPLTGPATIIVVGCRIYIEGYSSLSEGLNLILVSLIATPSPDPNDSPRYALVEDNCVRDDTFMILPRPDDSIVRAKFEMFEFASEIPKQNSEKLPVFLHATFLVCMNSDTSPACTQGCVNRRRRDSNSVTELANAVTKTIGPYYVENKRDVSDDDVTGDAMLPDEDVVDYDESEDQLPRRRIELVIPQSSTSYTFIGHTLFLMVAVLAVVYFVRQFIQRPATTSVFSSPGVVPYHHCSKTKIDYPHCYMNNALPPPCDACCEKSSSANVEVGQEEEQTTDEQPPQYAP